MKAPGKVSSHHCYVDALELLEEELEEDELDELEDEDAADFMAVAVFIAVVLLLDEEDVEDVSTGVACKCDSKIMRSSMSTLVASRVASSVHCCIFSFYFCRVLR